ncbi:hypothetical protein [Pseudobutyrivibrio sp.]|uniref:hypothetical protein n=1 Tax=Pseudobutyrivibrio sp. TaxID=2014367 RepID=UPI0025E60C4C|nr:hypothetical protein [Pseudobutyrivibrio sp.]MBR5648910.1 hypothetical protein [Pseudobutyrivibrio sp.]
MKKFDKISKTGLNVKVVAQSCGNDCTETVWAGKTASEGNSGGCWTATGQTPRTTKWF